MPLHDSIFSFTMPIIVPKHLQLCSNNPTDIINDFLMVISSEEVQNIRSQWIRRVCRFWNNVVLHFKNNVSCYKNFMIFFALATLEITFSPFTQQCYHQADLHSKEKGQVIQLPAWSCACAVGSWMWLLGKSQWIPISKLQACGPPAVRRASWGKTL